MVKPKTKCKKVQDTGCDTEYSNSFVITRHFCFFYCMFNLHEGDAKMLQRSRVVIYHATNNDVRDDIKARL